MTTDFVELTTELSQKRGRHRKIKPITVDYILVDVFRNETPVFLKLLASSAEIDLSRTDFVRELLTLVELRNQENVFLGTYVYSVTVISPAKPNLPLDVYGSLSLVHQPQVRVGYIHHELLYSLPAPELEMLLTKFVQSANGFELSVKPSAAAFTQKKRVRLL